MQFKNSQQSLPGFLALTTLTSLTHADSENYCNNSEFQTYNATGSIYLPGFQPPGATNLLGAPPTGTWTISTAIKQHLNYTANTSHVDHTFWLDTNPFVNLSSSDLPYIGCALLLYPNPASTTIIVPGTDENGCQGVFDSDCYNAIIAAVNNTGNCTGHHQHLDCGNYFNGDNFPTECQGKWTFKGMGFRSMILLLPIHSNDIDRFSDAFGHDSYLDGCASSVSVGNGNATIGSISDARSETTHNMTNFTTYDRFVSQSTPVILTA
jgi:hypothetical protein